MKFIPDTQSNQNDIPFLDQARSDDGWQGHTTNESIQALRAHISAEIARLGGSVTRWMPGTFHDQGYERPGVQIAYQIIGPNEILFEGRINVAGLPWKEPYGGKKSHGGYKSAVENKRKQSLAMALYNIREALKAMRIIQVLSPGYAALVPWMLKPGTEQTIGELWNIGSAALPAPSKEGDIVNSDFEVIEE